MEYQLNSQRKTKVRFCSYIPKVFFYKFSHLTQQQLWADGSSHKVTLKCNFTVPVKVCQVLRRDIMLIIIISKVITVLYYEQYISSTSNGVNIVKIR